MNFQRGLAPKEAIGVGQIAIAIEIEDFYILDPTEMFEDPSGNLKPRRIPRLATDTIEALKNIMAGHPGRNLRFYGFKDKEGKHHRISEFKGLYVKFKDTTYKIPK